MSVKRKKQFCVLCGSSNEKYLSVSSASELLDCSEQFFRNLIRDRKICFAKFGRLVRIPISEIEKLKVEYLSISKIYEKSIA